MSVPAIQLEGGGGIELEGGSGKIILENVSSIYVPNVVGMYYYDAQQALLGAGFMIAPPSWISPTTISGTGGAFTADSDLTIDAPITVDATTGTGNPVSFSIPGIVVTQSLAPGTQCIQQTQVTITVVGFTVINQPNNPVYVP